jgi:hypothetical protein
MDNIYLNPEVFVPLTTVIRGTNRAQPRMHREL